MLKKCKFFDVLKNFQQTLHTKRSQTQDFTQYKCKNTNIFAPPVHEHVSEYVQAYAILRKSGQTTPRINNQRSLTFTYMIVTSHKKHPYQWRLARTSDPDQLGGPGQG